LNEETLIQGCLRGSVQHQRALYERYAGKMYAVCLRYARTPADAADILQEGFIKVYTKLNQYHFQGSFEGWIRRIISNTAIDHLRKAKKDPFLSDNDNDFKSAASDPMIEQEEIVLHELKAELAMEAIQKLSPAYRTVFSMYVLEEYSHKEIAEKLGISEGTSKSNLAKAKMNLQRILNERLTKVSA